MPLFFVHGFKWDREAIRIFVILNNLEDASPDYVMAGLTPQVFRATLNKKFPGLLAAVPDLTFIEQHDPEDLRVQSQPYAFVCDTVIEANLSVNVTEAMSGNLGAAAWDKMGDLRDRLAAGQELGWFAVWNGDVERADTGEDVASVGSGQGQGHGMVNGNYGGGGHWRSTSGSGSLGGLSSTQEQSSGGGGGGKLSKKATTTIAGSSDGNNDSHVKNEEKSAIRKFFSGRKHKE